jgi:predicted outer membrane protein
MRDDLLRRLSFSSPIGGLYLSKLVQFFGDMVTDPMVAGEYYYDEGDKTNDLLSIFSLRGLGPLASLLRNVFLAEVESVVDNEYTGREFGERGEGEKLLDALDLGKPNWARTIYRRELEGAKQAALRESYKESDRVYVMRARDAISRMNNEFSSNTIFGLKNLSMAERTNIMNDLVRVQKAAHAVGPDGDEKYYDNAIEFYEKKLSEILTGAISKRQLAALEPVLGSRYDALYGKYSGVSTKALPEHVKASVNEWASALLKDKILRWKQYYNTHVNQ